MHRHSSEASLQLFENSAVDKESDVSYITSGIFATVINNLNLISVVEDITK
jgi:hypothetical protein